MDRRNNNSSGKLEVKFACEHIEVRAKSQRFNELIIKRDARKLCSACVAECDAKRKRMIEDSIQRTDETSKLKLTGSRKQIEWAERIRERWLFDLQRDIPPLSLRRSVERATSHTSGKERAFAVQQAITSVLALRLTAIDEVLGHSEAAWWLDWRDRLNERINKSTDDAIRSQFELLLAS